MNRPRDKETQKEDRKTARSKESGSVKVLGLSPVGDGLYQFPKSL